VYVCVCVCVCMCVAHIYTYIRTYIHTYMHTNMAGPVASFIVKRKALAPLVEAFRSFETSECSLHGKLPFGRQRCS
jgi:hypothetical protein